MKEVKTTYDIGVIVGRFQINELHSEHKKMVDEVISRHDKILLLLGVASVPGTQNNALDFLSRKVMFEEEYGNKISVIMPIHDKKSDHVWSNQLDTKIREVFPFGSVVLYGSKESFIPRYHGKYPTIQLQPESMVSATDIRKAISKKVERNKEFRSGVIYSCYNNYNIVHPTIDVAIMNEDESQVLLGRKKDEVEFRFIGGFADVNDESLEQTVRREAYEETSIEIGDIKYLASFKVNDWRYRSVAERSIMTTFFKAKKIFGTGTESANDDIVEVRWFNIHDLKGSDVVSEHEKLLHILKTSLGVTTLLKQASN